MKENIDPKMHTAEHLLNQAMVRVIGSGRCFSAHIERRKSKCDYKFDRGLTPEELEKIEKEVSLAIAANLPVTEKFVSEPDAQKIYDKYDLGKLPSNDGLYRIIDIGDYDSILCVGPHVKSTKELGSFNIISSSYENGVLRIRYKLKPVGTAFL